MRFSTQRVFFFLVLACETKPILYFPWPEKNVRRRTGFPINVFWGLQAVKSLTDGKKLDPLILAQVKTCVECVIFFSFLRTNAFFSCCKLETDFNRTVQKNGTMVLFYDFVCKARKATQSYLNCSSCSIYEIPL